MMKCDMHVYKHYSDVTMSILASQITGVSIVFSAVCSGAGCGGIGIFVEKLAFEMLTVHGQQHLFSIHERMFYHLFHVVNYP